MLKNFPEFNHEDKIINSTNKARVRIMIHKSITYKRMPNCEDSINTSISIKIKDGKRLTGVLEIKVWYYSPMIS